MSEQKKPCLFGTHFNLHPMDAFLHTENLTTALQAFTNAFKDRIEAQINYSKAMLKIGKQLERYINPEQPTPLSYISSAFKVQHEQRARHALQLAQYLHTEIEVPCQVILEEQQAQMKRIEKDLKKIYKQAESVEESYQKNLKKYYRSKQDLEENMIDRSVLQFTPCVTQAQKQKAHIKLSEEIAQNEQNQQKYQQSMNAFNAFAARYNNTISDYLLSLQEMELNGLAMQTDCIRKLIVSQVNMFKNIEYDLLNISRQMEAVKPQTQIQSFVVSCKDIFKNPIITIYAEGPVANKCELIDFKIAIKHSLLEYTLVRIDRGLFTWILQNKNNSTLRYTVQRLLKRYEEKEAGDNDFLQEFETSISSNRTVRDMPIDGIQGKERFLNVEEVYSLCIEIVAGIAQFMRSQELYQAKIKSLYELIEGCLSTHHFYRFVAYLTLDEYQSMHEQKVQGKLANQHYTNLLKMLIEKSLKAKDVFIARNALSLLFMVNSQIDNRQRLYFRQPEIRQIKIWQDRDFWQAAIFQTTFELISSLPLVERTELKEVYLMRQKNVVFSGLVEYCHYMIMLGNEVGEARSLMGRMAHIYNLYEEHERDLSKTIANSYEQYKEILAD